MLNEQIGKLPYDKENALFCFIAVRGDIPSGMQGAQALHAALCAGNRFGAPDELRVAFLKAKDHDELLDVKDRLEKDGIEHETFHEPDWGIGFSAIATAPTRRSETKAFKKLRTWTP